MSDKVALITGVTGQDGAYLAEYLLRKGYVVHGVKLRASSLNTARVDHLYEDPHFADTKFFLHYGDMTDATNLIRLMQETQPTEIYNRGGPGCLNRFSASISGVSAEFRLPRGAAAG
jgi:GDPmannose 4,6-dehydratase